MATGVVKFWQQERGYGFILPDTGGSDVFVHFRGCLGNYIPFKGDPVRFEMGERDGKPCARSVELIE